MDSPHKRTVLLDGQQWPIPARVAMIWPYGSGYSMGKLCYQREGQGVMARKLVISSLLVAGLLGASSAYAASPIFGTAAVTPTTVTENKTILGKGYYADYYGSVGISNLNYSSAYASYGDYTSAGWYAYEAYYYFSTAQYYLANGY